MDEQLIAAIVSQNLTLVEELLSAGANPNTKQGRQTVYQLLPVQGADELKCALIESGAENPELKYFLAQAIGTGRLKAVQILIAKGADLNLVTSLGTPIQVAASRGDLAIVEELIAAGADLDAGSSINTPLLAAIANSHTAVALRLIAAGANPSRMPRLGLAKPIAKAVVQNDVAVIQALIATGADGDVQLDETVIPNRPIDQQEVTSRFQTAIDSVPVILAARCGHRDALIALIEAGADPAIRDGEGLSAYDWASRYQDQEILAILKRFGVTETGVAVGEKLLLAAESGDILTVQDCLNQGADANTRDRRSNTKYKTPLMLAAARGHLAIVKILLAAGAEVALVDRIDDDDQPLPGGLLEEEHPEELINDGYRLGRTALMLAATGSHVAIVKCLIAAGANPNQADGVGYTALSLAAENYRLEVLQTLVIAGADVNHAATYGNTPLILACIKGLATHAVTIAEFLLNHGADINQVNHDQETALMKAAKSASVPLIRLLLDRGANVNVVSEAGQTAIALAVAASHYVEVKEGNLVESNYREYRDDGSICSWQSQPEHQIVEIVQMLLQAGADPNIPNCQSTPLIEAARHGQLQILQLLLNAGARLDVIAGCRDTVVSIARLYKQQHILAFLQEFTGTDLSEFV